MTQGHRLAGVLVALSLLAACGSAADLVTDPSPDNGEVTSEPDTDPSPGLSPDSLEDYYAQKPDWVACGEGQECASIVVPQDYANPGGHDVELVLNRLPATQQSIGALVVNPGGPGGSGFDYAVSFAGQAGDAVRESYDIVGFDPRGVGRSDPIECYDTEELDAYVSGDPDPDTDAEGREFFTAVEDLGDACRANSGDLVEHVSTIEVARDLDVIRGVLGENRLNYFGASYGTYIGATYAELFPKRVGRMVLDGAIDPRLTAEELSIGQAEGFERAVQAYTADCVDDDSCPFPGDEAEVAAALADFLQQLDAEPLPTNDSERPLTEGLGFYGVAVTMYDERFWGYLSDALEAALDGNGSALLVLADAYTHRTADGYQDNAAEVISAVNCLDHPLEPPTLAEVEERVDAYLEVAPTFGRALAWSEQSCGYWPAKPTVEPLSDYDAAGAAPILVIGTTRDPATPYEWAQGLADELSSGVLLTRDGDGHTGYAMGNACVDGAVDTYLVEGQPPDDGTTC